MDFKQLYCYFKGLFSIYFKSACPTSIQKALKRKEVFASLSTKEERNNRACSQVNDLINPYFIPIK
ncbi:hypothetical protein BpHYR1_048201 [Brachionus plicatilis]|uniref:Uncharacterized protein n=1 Tax=Brachionus plicatilis TaxID=10195 RepID=A0A3M7RU74_BRAPC|nr:hypothetical protein BpHYR1_048201 [Brachionus plicatilis]